MCLIGGTNCAEHILAACRIVQRRAIDGSDQVAGAQAQAYEGLAIAARVDAVAALLALREHRLRAHDVGDQPRIVVHQLAHPVHHRILRRQCGSRGRGAVCNAASLNLPRQQQVFQAPVAVQHDSIAHDRVQLGAARNVVSHRIHFGGGRARAEDSQTVAGV